MYGDRYELQRDEPVRNLHGLPRRCTPRNSFAGFTLIELMIVILIILILSGGSVAAFLNFNKTESIQNDARNLEVELSRSRTAAVSLQYPSGCETLRGVNIASVQIAGKLNGFKVTTLCDPINYEGAETKILGSSVFQSAFDITFMPSTGYTQSGTSTQIVVVLESDTSVTKTVNVSPVGIPKVL